MNKTIKMYTPKKTLEKLQIIIILFCLFFILCFIFSKEIETIITFPGIFKEKISYKSNILNPEIIQITDKKGNNIQWIYVDKKAEKTVYYFHGNKESLPYFYKDIDFIANLGFNVMAFDYQGYWASEWFPYEEAILQASDKFYRFLKVRKDFEEKNVIIWWYGIGASIAVNFTYHHQDVDRMILIAPPASHYDMSVFLFGIPIQNILNQKNSFITFEKVQDFSFPIYILHGTADTAIPFNQGKKVFKNIGKNLDFDTKKYFFPIKNVDHLSILKEIREKYKSPIHVFLEAGFTKK